MRTYIVAKFRILKLCTIVPPQPARLWSCFLPAYRCQVLYQYQYYTTVVRYQHDTRTVDECCTSTIPALSSDPRVFPVLGGCRPSETAINHCHTSRPRGYIRGWRRWYHALPSAKTLLTRVGRLCPPHASGLLVLPSPPTVTHRHYSSMLSGVFLPPSPTTTCG